jgi:hypothetical protein
MVELVTIQAEKCLAKLTFLRRCLSLTDLDDQDRPLLEQMHQRVAQQLKTLQVEYYFDEMLHRYLRK